MTSNMKTHIQASTISVALSMAFLFSAPLANAQAPARYLGTITAISGTTLTVQPDAGDARQVEVPSSAPIKRIAPGQKDLSTAETIQFSDLATGDRVLVKLDPDAPGTTPQAAQIIAIKQADVAQKQEKEREEWQKHGVGGLVKSVDPASGAIALTTGAGTTAKTVTVHIAKTTILKRYALASERFDAALPAPIAAIQPGDQLRARGTKNADGSEFEAEEVVSGTFRNIAGIIISLDTAGSTLVVKDLATKKPVTIHITADAQMRRLPDRMAAMLAARLKGTAGASGTPGGNAQPPNGAAPNGAGPSGVAMAAQHSAPRQGAGQAGGGDPQQMLNRAPSIQLVDLKKGDAVMLVSTQGAAEVTAITLLAGVEPLLEAPAASQNLLSNWSMNSGTPEAAQ
jgi:hypothetical protein